MSVGIENYELNESDERALQRCNELLSLGSLEHNEAAIESVNRCELLYSYY